MAPKKLSDLFHIAVLALNYRELVSNAVVFLEEVGRADALQAAARHDRYAVSEHVRFVHEVSRQDHRPPCRKRRIKVVMVYI